MALLVDISPSLHTCMSAHHTVSNCNMYVLCVNMSVTIVANGLKCPKHSAPLLFVAVVAVHSFDMPAIRSDVSCNPMRESNLLGPPCWSLLLVTKPASLEYTATYAVHTARQIANAAQCHQLEDSGNQKLPTIPTDSVYYCCKLAMVWHYSLFATCSCSTCLCLGRLTVH